jgi:hypothetical protein
MRSRALASRRCLAASFIPACVSLCGCSDRDLTELTSREPPPVSDDTPPVSAPGDGGDETAPLYVVAPWVIGLDDDSTAYVGSVPALDGGEVRLDDAIEYPGGATVFGPAAKGVFYVAPYSAPVVEQWSVKRDGSFAKGATLSFANLGIADAGGTQVFSQGKAYFLGAGELVIWDPTKMELIGTVPLPLEYTGAGVYEPNTGLVELGPDRIMVYLHWSDVDDWSRWASYATQVTFDTVDDRVLQVFDEPRCEMLEPYGKQTSSGTRYFSSDPAYQLPEIFFGSEYGSRSCGLRVLNPDGRFDPDFQLDPSSLVGGRPAGTVTMVSDDTAFIDVFHPELFDKPLTAENADAANSAAAYRFWIWHPGEAEAVDSVVQSPRTSSSLWQYVIDGRVFAQDHDVDYSHWSLLELHPDGSVSTGLSGAGYATSGLVRVR